jgi:hypothetical protein
MVFYQQQHLVLLAQISEQISSIAPQVPIPSTPLPSYDFSPNSSDVRVNVYWFMSLVFSLTAALLATLVQQWIRDYMHVFERYSNPLKSARLRQYLYEGVEGWYMPRVARSVPGLVHVSLFLFFVGLGDSLLTLNTTVSITTVIPIAICGLLYIFCMFAPIINPQSPFQNPFSALIWYLKQKVYPRHYLDRASGGSFKAVSSNLPEAQMQLAMEENDERKGRDVRAIGWLIHNRTEDDEMESFVMAIPGSFTSEWGIKIWRKVSEVTRDEVTKRGSNDLTDRSQTDAALRISSPQHYSSPLLQHITRPRSLLHLLGRIIPICPTNVAPRNMTMSQSLPRVPHRGRVPDDPHVTGDIAIYDLCKRVRHLLGTCDNHSIFTNQELWLKRARGCVETAASLVFCVDVKTGQFGDLERSLPPLFKFVGNQGTYHTAPGADGLFYARLSCLSFVIFNQGMENHDGIKLDARVAIDTLSRFRIEDEREQTNDDDEVEDGRRNVQRIDRDFEAARQFCVFTLREAFRPSGEETTEEQVREVLARDHEADICMLERMALAMDQEENIDMVISTVNYSICSFADDLITWERGACFDQFEETELIQPTQFFNPTPDIKMVFLPQFIFLRQRLRLLCSYSSKLRDIINGQGDGAYQEMLESLGALWTESDNQKFSAVQQRHLMERQLWRLQDLRDSGGFGFGVELSFLVIDQLLKIPLSPDAHSSLIIGMFKTITSNWRQHKHSIGTQRVILNLVCDMATPNRGLLSDLELPMFITDELLVLLENIVEGQSGSHIDEVMKEMDDAIKEQDAVESTQTRLFREEVVKVISRSRAPVYSSVVPSGSRRSTQSEYP